MDLWKAKREAVGDNKTCFQAQIDDINPSRDETTKTDQLNSDAQGITIPTVLTKKKGAINTNKMHHQTSARYHRQHLQSTHQEERGDKEQQTTILHRGC
jgi:hypothetical protein